MGSTPIYSIPFADPTDLVRDWPALSEDVADAVEAAISGLPVPDPPAGIGSNVVQTVKTDPFRSTSTSFVPVPGLSATITPTAEDSKVLIIVQITTSQRSDTGSFFKLTGGNTSGYVGDAEGNRPQAVFGGFYRQDQIRSTTYAQSMVFLDSPSTTSATTYGVEASGTSSAPQINVNRTGDNLDSGNEPRTTSSITLIEVAA